MPYKPRFEHDEGKVSFRLWLAVSSCSDTLSRVLYLHSLIFYLSLWLKIFFHFVLDNILKVCIIDLSPPLFFAPSRSYDLIACKTFREALRQNAKRLSSKSLTGGWLIVVNNFRIKMKFFFIFYLTRFVRFAIMALWVFICPKKNKIITIKCHTCTLYVTWM